MLVTIAIFGLIWMKFPLVIHNFFLLFYGIVEIYFLFSLILQFIY